MTSQHKTNTHPFLWWTSWHKTGTYPFLWQASIRPVLIHFFDRLAQYRYSSIFMTSQHKTCTHPFFMTSHHKTGTHPFLWQAGIRPVLIHFYDKPAQDLYSSIFMTSHHKTGTHPFLWQASIKTCTHPFLWQATIRPVLIHFYDKPP